MMIADGSKRGKADPAFVALTDVISHWARAVWNTWLPIADLQASLNDARTRFTAAAQPWRIVYGPAAALVCTHLRLNWTIRSATQLTTDQGRLLDLASDPPVVVARQSDAAVGRWKWEKHGCLPPFASSRRSQL